MIRFLSAGESHGRGVTFILEGIPAGFHLDFDFINKELARRQNFFGRGGRMKIEKDRVEIIGGVRGGKTLGSPLCFIIWNRDWENWKEVMHPIGKSSAVPLTRPRPGHADLAGIMKFLQSDIRNILERASARETAARVAAGAVCKLFLKELNIGILGWVEEIGGVKAEWKTLSKEEIRKRICNSSLLTPDPQAEKEMKNVIKKAEEEGYTLGGIFRVIVENPPPGLGSFTQWDLRLDALLAQALMSIPGVKGVEIGEGFELARREGSEAMDEIFFEKGKFRRRTNRMGGIEGGISNGEDIVLRAIMKPIPTQKKPLSTVDIHTKEKINSWVERGDTTAVPSCCVVAESMVALTISNEIKKKFGGDSWEELKSNYFRYLERIENL
ncbi:chorismate synthase [Candidatus Calescamantes bacterium]|nr:chorismate synthase [Candidatus Calescamantes bacterium]